MIGDIETAASNVGITAVVSNSNEKIETTLNRITGIEQLPIMLISWDYTTTITFDESGFINNPSTNIVCLLMTKAESLEKSDLKTSSEEMGTLFIEFVRGLNNILKFKTRDGSNAISNVSYTNVPSHGRGVHSGVLGNFTMLTGIESNCID